MFLPIDNGTKIIIEGPEAPFEIWLPPVGYGCHNDTGEIGPTDIIKRSNKKSEQYWERPELPKDWQTKLKRERLRAKAEKNSDYSDPELDKIREREWRRRLYGVWFYNEGEATYITGTHYMLLTYWIFQRKHFDYREPNRDFFYVLQYCIEDPNCLGLIEVTKRKEGKCFGKDTPIRMYDGSIKAVQEVNEGDLVMGDDSTPRTASGITRGKEKMYRIKANKGESFTCNASHILALMWNGLEKPNYKGWKKGDKINISVKDYLNLKDWEKAHLVMYRRGWGDHFEEVMHKIPSYMVGLFLGDGSKSNGAITTIDPEILNSVKEFSESLDLKLTRDKITYRISQKNTKLNKNGIQTLDRFTLNPYKTELRRLNLLDNKHIPKEYMIDSEKNRLELLAGIIDTDGFLERKIKGHPMKYEITQSNHSLADDIAELARSLGFFVSIKDKKISMKRSDGSYYNSIGKRICIYGDLSRIPCKLPRRICESVKRRKDSLNFGFRVEEIEENEYYGFTVDKNHLFLLADGTVVHNTARAGLFLYEYISRSDGVHGGIQSKTDNDAAEVYRKAVMHPWRKLPEFFRPIFDTGAGDSPAKGLYFFNPSKRGNAADLEDDDRQALESFIDFKPATPEAYDGPQLERYVSDEAGKLKKHKITDRHDTVMFCSEVDGNFIGKHLYTTTVEEMESGGSDFKELVKRSDRNYRDANGRTKSGLYTYFLPAHHTMYYNEKGESGFNKYGKPDKERGLLYFMNRRDALKDNPNALSSFIRKNPFTLQEAFRVDGDKCLYANSVEALNDQRDFLSYAKNTTTRGNFVWKDGIRDSKVVWVSSPQGRWEVSWLFDRPDQSNLVDREGNYFVPKNTMKFIAGADTFSHDNVEDNRRSNGAMLVKMKLDPFNDSIYNDTFVCKYKFRAASSYIQYEDMLMTAVYFGCQVLFESNKNNWKKYFIDRGYEAFLMKLPAYPDYGMPGNAGTHQILAEETADYLLRNCSKTYFLDLIEEWLEFDINNTTKFDTAMAAGYCLIGDRMYVVSNRTEEESTELEDYGFKKHRLKRA